MRGVTTGVSASLALALACLAVRGLSGCRHESAPPNILLISLDACRADHLGTYGYSRDTSPFIDTIAARGTVFTHAFINTLGTPPSHATMLTSLYQETHRVDYSPQEGPASYRLPAEVALLQEHLQRGGYTTVGVTGGGYLTREFGYARGFDAFDATARGQHVGAGKLLRLVERHGGGGQPVFAFFHTYSIHSPYSPPPEYRDLWGPSASRFEPTSQNLLAINKGEIEVSEEDVEHIVAMYDAGIRYTDDALRRLFANLDQLGFFTNYLVVITADHGEEFGERGGFVHRPLLYDDLLHVPLILEGTTVPRGRRDQSLASTVDIAPTILRVAGVETDAPLEGRVLLTSKAPGAIYAQSRSDRYAIRTNDWKLILNQRPRTAELFDLRSDPKERKNVVERYPDEARSLEERLWTWRRGLPAIESLPRPDLEVSGDTVERLEELGYVE
jgi:choline-sulfatase